MLRTRVSIALITSLALIGACGSDEKSTDSTTNTTEVPATTAPATTEPATTVPATTVPATTAPATTVPVMVDPAVWPAADMVFTTPEAAAIDFLSNVFGDGPVIGEFMAGDSRSGEFEVFATESGTRIGDARSVLFMRQLGPDDGWFVIGAGSEVATITTPATLAVVPAAPLTVSGVGTGFEATIVVRAFLAGDTVSEFDREVTMAGNFGESLPYTVELDLSTAESGDVVVLMINGGTGLETDPGDFSAIVVVIE